MIRLVILLILIGCSPLYLDSHNDSNIKTESTYDLYAVDVGTNKTIMTFISAGEMDELFFSRVISVENYKNGRKHGFWRYYKEDGSIDKVEMYRNGELVK